MKKILITGATGFLGKYLVEEFKANDYYVFALGRNESVGKELECSSVKFVKCDLNNKNKIHDVVSISDGIIHAAALSTVWGKWDDFYEANVIGTKNVAEACLKNNKRLVYVSSPSVYTEAKDRYNILEEDYDKSNELNYYIKSKILSEDIVNENIRKGLDATIIRPRGLFGIGDTSLIPRILRVNSKIGVPLVNNGKNIVDITCVENVAYALRLCFESENTTGKTYNISNGEPTEFKKILEDMMKEIGMQPKYLKISKKDIYRFSNLLEKIYRTFHLKGEPPLTNYTAITLSYSQTLNIDKARNDFGYIPIMSLKEGIEKYAKDYRQYVH